MSISFKYLNMSKSGYLCALNMHHMSYLKEIFKICINWEFTTNKIVRVMTIHDKKQIFYSRHNSKIADIV